MKFKNFTNFFFLQFFIYDFIKKKITRKFRNIYSISVVRLIKFVTFIYYHQTVHSQLSKPRLEQKQTQPPSRTSNKIDSIDEKIKQKLKIFLYKNFLMQKLKSNKLVELRQHKQNTHVLSALQENIFLHHHLLCNF